MVKFVICNIVHDKKGIWVWRLYYLIDAIVYIYSLLSFVQLLFVIYDIPDPIFLLQ